MIKHITIIMLFVAGVDRRVEYDRQLIDDLYYSLESSILARKETLLIT